ncbi:hypothetical protein [Roseovarius sp. MMSF_3281]|uniref:hypothetical protein n=1 Tax=Roseovarius sp. MMSF_3281 TaxID=3046694 RepID=UPI00273DF28B|nr:hypothetical protein [Roseovarius sp. MMSF_3281]
MIPNAFRDDLKPKFGVPQIKPRLGETFDKNNDLTLGEDGRTVYHRDGYVSYGGPADAIVDYDKRHMHPAAFNEHYADGDERSESMMLHGANG